MSSPTASESSNPAISVDRIAEAAERRASASSRNSHLTEIEEHEKRQQFRRLIDPGILRPNAKEVAMASLHVLGLPDVLNCTTDRMPSPDFTNHCRKSDEGARQSKVSAIQVHQ